DFRAKIDKKIETLDSSIEKKLHELTLDLSGKIGKLENRVKELESENCQLRGELLQIIHGLDTQQKNSEIEIGDISDSYRLGDGDSSAILVELISFKKKRKIFENSFKLKETGVFVSSDPSPSERIRQKAVVQQLRVAKQGGKDAKIRRTRIIDGKSYTGEQMEVFLREEQQRN
ncbi:hypothetical protein HHI36_010054, partial [Cryptolaemus montrouzieri]